MSLIYPLGLNAICPITYLRVYVSSLQNLLNSIRDLYLFQRLWRNSPHHHFLRPPTPTKETNPKTKVVPKRTSVDSVATAEVRLLVDPRAKQIPTRAEQIPTGAEQIPTRAKQIPPRA